MHIGMYSIVLYSTPSEPCYSDSNQNKSRFTPTGVPTTYNNI